MTEEIKKSKKRGKKIEAERGAEPQIVKEDEAIKEEKKYEVSHLIMAIEDLSIKVNNAYFKAPFNRCPDCNKGNNTIMAHFGVGGANKIGNLAGFQATIGDVIGWSGNTYKGISIVKGKMNGVFELETAPFDVPRKEPAVVERMVVPSIYRPILGEMAEFLASGVDAEGEDFVEIGKRKYPNVIAEKL